MTSVNAVSNTPQEDVRARPSLEEKWGVPKGTPRLERIAKQMIHVSSWAA